MSTTQERANTLSRTITAILGEDDAFKCCGYSYPCEYHALRKNIQAALAQQQVQHELSAGQNDTASWASKYSSSSNTTNTTIPEHLPPTPEPDVSISSAAQAQNKRSSFSWRMSGKSFRSSKAPSIRAPSIKAPSFRSHGSGSLVEVEGDYPTTIHNSCQITKDMFPKQDGCLTVMSPNCEWLGFFRKDGLRLYNREDCSQGSIAFDINLVDGTENFISGAALLTDDLAVFSNPFKVWHFRDRKHIFNKDCRPSSVCCLAASPSGIHIAVASKTRTGTRIQLIEFDLYRRTIKSASQPLDIAHEVTALHISDSRELLLGLNVPTAPGSSSKTEREGYIYLYTLQIGLGLPTFTFKAQAAVGNYGTADDRGITRIVRPTSPSGPESNFIAVSTWTQTCAPALFRLTSGPQYTFERIKFSTSGLLLNGESRIQSMAMTPSGGNLVVVGGKNEILLLKTSMPTVRPRRIGEVRRAGSPREGAAVGWVGEEECFVVDRGGRVQWFLLGS